MFLHIGQNVSRADCIKEERTQEGVAPIYNNADRQQFLKNKFHSLRPLKAI